MRGRRERVQLAAFDLDCDVDRRLSEGDAHRLLGHASRQQAHHLGVGLGSGLGLDRGLAARARVRGLGLGSGAEGSGHHVGGALIPFVTNLGAVGDGREGRRGRRRWGHDDRRRGACRALHLRIALA